MKTYEIIIEGKSFYFKSTAGSEDIKKALDFIDDAYDKSLERALQALRLLGFKCTPITIDPVDIFEF